MKIYHTETQVDYDALMAELEKRGNETLPEDYWSIFETATTVIVRTKSEEISERKKGTTYFDLGRICSRYPGVPITEYKAKADEKMRFTKENVYRFFGDYRRNKNGIHRLDNLESVIMDLDDTPEKSGSA